MEGAYRNRSQVWQEITGMDPGAKRDSLLAVAASAALAGTGGRSFETPSIDTHEWPNREQPDYLLKAWAEKFNGEQ